MKFTDFAHNLPRPGDFKVIFMVF